MADHDLTVLPSGLPAPEDDGAASHLFGSTAPAVALQSTSGNSVNLAVLPGLTVVYAYPMTARPGTEQPRGWDAIPGARGCTAEACAFRDHQSELRAAGVDHLFGLSSQSSAYQREAASRLHLPFALLSDSEFALADAWRLPTFEVGTQRLLKRLTLVLRNGCVEKVFYPVFPPDEHAEQVLRYVAVA